MHEYVNVCPVFDVNTHTNTNIKSLEQNIDFLGNTSHKHQHSFHGIFPRMGNNEIKATDFNIGRQFVI
jgi:hypothetical protein